MRIHNDKNEKNYEIERVKRPDILPGRPQEEKSETLQSSKRIEKINELKKRVQSGTYTINPERIAQSISSFYMP
jgi:anti-sigma28 factor (negative regulator of flagellin synthesis)